MLGFGYGADGVTLWGAAHCTPAGTAGFLDGGFRVEGDGVHLARAGQDPRDAHASLETMVRELLERGVVVTACGTCCQTRGLALGDLVGGVTVGTIHDLAALVARSDRTLTF